MTLTTLPQVPGGTIEDSKVLKGVMVNKDVVHAKMRRSVDGSGTFSDWSLWGWW